MLKDTKTNSDLEEQHLKQPNSFIDSKRKPKSQKITKKRSRHIQEQYANLIPQKASPQNDDSRSKASPPSKTTSSFSSCLPKGKMYTKAF